MGDQSIRGYIGGLEQRGELVRFRDPVDPLSNLTAIGWKTYDRLGKASLFTNLTGFPGWQAVNQIVCDRRKWAIALGVDEDEVVATLSARFARHIDPVSVGRDGAPVKEVVLAGKDADLTQVPAPYPNSRSRTSKREPARARRTATRSWSTTRGRSPMGRSSTARSIEGSHSPSSSALVALSPAGSRASRG